MDATTVAVDVAKTTFEIAIANRQWQVIGRQRLTRARFARFLTMTPPTCIVMEACSTAHYWGRQAREHSHTVTLLPPAYVRPYVRRNKTDRTDAEALLEAVRSGQLPAVPIKTIEQQALVALHRVRAQWMTTRIARLNALHGLLGEYGIVLPPLRHGLRRVPAILADAQLPDALCRVLTALYDEIRAVEARVAALDRELQAIARRDTVAQRLQTIPGVGPMIATALLGSVGHIQAFRRGRQFASWLGLTPTESSSGAQRRLGSISKRGDAYLRCLLIHGARSVMVAAQRRHANTVTPLQQWARDIAARGGANKASVALANKMARIIWAVWTTERAFEVRPARAV